MAYANSKSEFSNRDKWIVSIISGVIFLVISSPYTYTITNNFFSTLGLDLSTSTGRPYILGLLIHTLIFILIIKLLMR